MTDNKNTKSPIIIEFNVANRKYGIPLELMGILIKPTDASPIAVETDTAVETVSVDVDAEMIDKVNVYKDKNGDNKTVKVTFRDGTSKVATVREPDIFNLYTGIKLCIEKYVLGNPLRNKIDNIAKKETKKYFEKQAAEILKQAEMKRKAEKAKEKKAKREARRAAERATDANTIASTTANSIGKI